jgi:hypothetical protein
VTTRETAIGCHRRVKLVVRYHVVRRAARPAAMLPPFIDLTKACHRAIKIDAVWDWNRRSIMCI